MEEEELESEKIGPENVSGGEDDSGDEEGGGIINSQLNRFFTELNDDEVKQKKRLHSVEKFKTRRSRSLPQHLHAVMGSANWKLARGQTEAAIKLCKEVIRQSPHSIEPYLTMATIFEEQGEDQEQLKVLLVAASLKRNDYDMWIKCAFLAKNLNNAELAERCFSKAIGLEPSNVDLYWEQFACLSELGEHRKIVECLEAATKLLQDLSSSSSAGTVLPGNIGQRIVAISKEVAQAHHILQETDVALRKLQDVMDQYPSWIDAEFLNIFTELSLSSQQYHKVYETITNFYGMLVDPAVQGGGEEERAGSSGHQPVSLGLGSECMADLTRALRLSISGENIDVELPQDMEKEGVGPAMAAPRSDRPMPNLIIPDNVPLDLRTKLAIAMVNTGKGVPSKLLEPVFRCPEENGDLFLDLAEAYYANAQYAEALPILSSLVRTEQYSQAGVWLKQGECQQMLGELEDAVVSFSYVLTLAPNHTDTRLKLASLYQQLGQVEDALAVLEDVSSGDMEVEEAEEEEMEEEEEMARPISKKAVARAISEEEVAHAGNERNSSSSSVTLEKKAKMEKFTRTPAVQEVRVTMHKYKLIMSTDKMEESVKTGEDLLAFYFRDVNQQVTREEFVESEKFKGLKTKLQQKKLRGRGVEYTEAKEVESQFSTEEWLGVLESTCKGLLKLDSPMSKDRITYLVFCALSSLKFRGTLELHPDCVHVWNIVGILPINDVVDKRILQRICLRGSTSVCHMYLGHLSLNSAMSFSLSTAVVMYEKAFREGGCKDYIPCLCLGITYFNLAVPTKNVHNRNGLILLGAGFLHTYVKLRGVCQESMYNMGRAFHQLGILHLASHFYNKVLTLDPECKDPEWSEASDLREEAAYNLSLIYRASGNGVLARHLLRTYCTV